MNEQIYFNTREYNIEKSIKEKMDELYNKKINIFNNEFCIFENIDLNNIDVKIIEKINTYFQEKKWWFFKIKYKEIWINNSK